MVSTSYAVMSFFRCGIASAPGTHSPAPPAVGAPGLLSCDYDEEWAAYAGTLDGLRLEGPPAIVAGDLGTGMPWVCARIDDELFRWSDSLTANTWPADEPWDKIKQMMYQCDISGPSKADKQFCPGGAEAVCLYGVISCMLCMAVMYAWNVDESPPWASEAISAARNLEALFMSNDKVFEFLDSSSWPFTVRDVAAVLDAYSPLLHSASSMGKSGAVPQRFSARPWSPESLSWRDTEEAARKALALVGRWTWPPSKGFPMVLKARARPQPVRLWALGTHCSLMAEPISAMALLLPEEFALEVTWRGTRDYCGYHSGSWPVPKYDADSPFRVVIESFTSKAADMTKLRAKTSHRDALATPKRFADKLRELLSREPTFLAADIGFCTEPAYACVTMHDTGKPIIGYLGVHAAFMLKGRDAQLELYRSLRDRVAQDPRSTLATVAPYISLQMFYHLPVELPAVRPLSLYTLPAMYTADKPFEVLVNKRPIAFFDVASMLEACVRMGGEDRLQFVDAGGLYHSGKHAYSDWASFRAAVYFPYDWLQTLSFYDFVNMAIPTFIPDSPLYTYAAGTNAVGEWDAVVWHVPPDVYPHHYSDWGDLVGRSYWWLLTDFRALPGVTGFVSVADLLEGITSQETLWRTSGQLRQAHLQRVGSATIFWREAILRAIMAT